MIRHPQRLQSLFVRGFYLAMSLWMVAIVLVGFWPTYYGPLLSGTFDLRPIVEIHAVVYSGWIVLFVAQTLLVYTGRVKWHRKLGWFAVGYAGLMVAVVLTALAMRFSDHMAAGDIREAHRSLVISSVVLMGPAVGRMTFLSVGPLILLVLYSPILLGMAFDLATRRLIHAVYVIGLITHVVSLEHPQSPCSV